MRGDLRRTCSALSQAIGLDDKGAPKRAHVGSSGVKAPGCCEPQRSRCGQVKCLIWMTQLFLKHQPASGLDQLGVRAKGQGQYGLPLSHVGKPDIFSQYACWAGGERGLFSLMPFKYVIIIVVITLVFTFTP